MRAEILTLALIVGAFTWAFRYFPTRADLSAMPQGGPLSRFLSATGIGLALSARQRTGSFDSGHRVGLGYLCRQSVCCRGDDGGVGWLWAGCLDDIGQHAPVAGALECLGK